MNSSRSENDGAVFEGLAASLGLGRIHHVALVVRRMDDALALWRDTLGLPVEQVVAVESDGVRIAFLPVGESKVELVEPVEPDTGVARYLESHGEGFHHVCLEVADLEQALAELARRGLELVDQAPRPGAEGPVAFLHPRSTQGVLVELIEAPGGPAWVSLGQPPKRQEAPSRGGLSAQGRFHRQEGEGER